MELGRTTSAFIRMIQKSVDVPYDSAVFRVHITQGDHVGKAVIVSWVTEDEPGSNEVLSIGVVKTFITRTRPRALTTQNTTMRLGLDTQGLSGL
ncbi:hypothetical protein CsSME_00009325 [Camellia sinensis var. sinensis]